MVSQVQKVSCMFKLVAVDEVVAVHELRVQTTVLGHGTRKCLVIVFAYFLKNVVVFVRWLALLPWLPHPRKSLDNISRELGVCQLDKDMQKSHDDEDDAGELVIRIMNYDSEHEGCDCDGERYDSHDEEEDHSLCF